METIGVSVATNIQEITGQIISRFPFEVDGCIDAEVDICSASKTFPFHHAACPETT
jgi:hypothetical protein